MMLSCVPHCLCGAKTLSWPKHQPAEPGDLSLVTTGTRITSNTARIAAGARSVRFSNRRQRDAAHVAAEPDDVVILWSAVACALPIRVSCDHSECGLLFAVWSTSLLRGSMALSVRIESTTSRVVRRAKQVPVWYSNIDKAYCHYAFAC